MKITLIGTSGHDTLESNMLEAFQNLEGINPNLIQWPPMANMSGLRIFGRILNKLSHLYLVRRFAEPFLVRKLKTIRPDLVIVFTGAARSISPKIVEQIKVNSKAVFCWFVDSSVNLSSSILYSKYDQIYFVDKGLLNYLAPIMRTKKSSILLEGFNLSHHKPKHLPSIGKNIAVVGSLYTERILLLEFLVERGFNLDIYGFGLPRGYVNGILTKFDKKKFVTLEKKSQVFQNSRCVLNSFHPAHINAINCRIFEAMASGALVVSQWSELLANTFIDGHEILLYKSYEDLILILEDLYRGKYDEMSIRNNAIKAVSSHSLDNRARSIISDYKVLIHSP